MNVILPRVIVMLLKNWAETRNLYYVSTFKLSPFVFSVFQHMGPFNIHYVNIQ